MQFITSWGHLAITHDNEHQIVGQKVFIITTANEFIIYTAVEREESGMAQ